MAIRRLVEKWRLNPDSTKWNVTPQTERLLKHWRRKDWPGRRPFFCQVEAAETVIWLTEVAPGTANRKKAFGAIGNFQQRSEPTFDSLGTKVGHWCGKDDGNGHVNRLAKP